MGIQKLLPLATSSGITQAVNASRTLVDGDSVNTLALAAVKGGGPGNGLFYKTTRRTLDGGKLVFDLDLFFCDPDAPSKASVFNKVFTAATTDICTVTGHGLKTGDGPFHAVNSGGALPAGLAVRTLYWAIVLSANTFKLAATLANAIAGSPTPVDITGTGTGTHTLRRATHVKHEALSMVDTDPRYVETVLNGKSPLVTATDQDSVTTDQRPGDLTNPVALQNGANDVALAGILTTDIIRSVSNVTDAAVIAASDLVVPANGRVVSVAGVAGSKTLLLLVESP